MCWSHQTGEENLKNDENVFGKVEWRCTFWIRSDKPFFGFSACFDGIAIVIQFNNFFPGGVLRLSLLLEVVIGCKDNVLLYSEGTKQAFKVGN